MRTVLNITGIEVELVVPPGPLEQIVAGRYAGFLGAPGGAVCTLEIEPNGGVEAGAAPTTPVVERAGGHRFEVAHPDFAGFFELRGRGAIRSVAGADAIDDALRTLFALLAPFHQGLLLQATGLIEGGGAHVFAGAGAAIVGRPSSVGLALPGGYVMVRRVADAWMAGSTPFQDGTQQLRLPRQARLAQLSLAGEALEDNVVLPNTDDGTRRAVRQLTSALATSMLYAPLPLDPLPGSDQRVVALREPAEVTNRWQ
jgi:hypothetical protein